MKEIKPEMFNGLESSLEVLDLSGNHIAALEANIFHHLEHIRVLDIEENDFAKINPSEAFNGLQYTLHSLDISGTFKAEFSIQEVKK